MISFVGILCFMGALVAVNGDERLLVDQLRWDFLMLEDKLWKFVLDYSKDGYNDTDDPGVTLVQSFHTFDKKIQQMPQETHQILYGLEVVRQTRPFLFLFSDLKVIDATYSKFRRYQASSLNENKYVESGYHRELMISHITDDVLYDPNININKTVNSIFQHTFSDRDDDNMISDLFDIVLESDYFCKNPNQPPQQVFYNLYNAIAMAELKGYIMIQFSYLAQRLEERGNYTELSQIARKQFQKRMTDALSILRGALEIVPGKLSRCDPKNHVAGKTYEELTALLQGYIENEADLNSDGTCTQTCQSYPKANNHGCYDWESQYCQRRKPCHGNIWSCRFVESHMNACISPTSSPRRYEYIEFKSGRVMGKKSWCYSKNVNSWYRWFVHCSYCVCVCDQQGRHSDRYFNLRPVMADVANNRVVTGLRIIKQNRIIHLQIQEGKLLPYGYIDNSTVRWVPVDDYKITDVGVQNGEDFHTMSYEKRTMLLDDLKTHEADHIVTGVRFEFIDNHLRFQVHVRGFDFKNGTLSNDAYYIYGTRQRQELSLHDSDIPTGSPQSIPNWSQNLYIQFTHTSFDKDAAQTTVPFFDAQPVAVYPAVPLRGAGIYYKGFNGYGGFVAPTITAYDFSRHLKLEFPKSQKRDDSEDVLIEPIAN